MNQHFTLFGLPETFQIDENALETRYRALAAGCHPDKFASASAFEQKQAVMMASAVNEAYRILKNPIDRAASLLMTQNIDAVFLQNPRQHSRCSRFAMCTRNG